MKVWMLCVLHVVVCAVIYCEGENYQVITPYLLSARAIMGNIGSRLYQYGQSVASSYKDD